MKRFLIPVWVLGLAVLLVLSTGACGTGGGVVVIDPVTLFSGTYCAGSFIGDEGVPDDATAQWGAFMADGAGNVGATLTENTNGVLNGPTVNPPLPYTVTASRQLTLLLGGMPFLQGGISADGKLACMASVLAGIPPAIYILGRKSGVYSNASLNAAYHFNLFYYDFTGMDDGTLYAGTMTFDGAGATASSAAQNVQGVIAAVGPFAGTYSVAADGTITGDWFNSEVTVEGAVLCGGELIIVAGSTTAGEIPALIVLIKKTAGASNATFNGTYHAVGIEASNAPPPETWLSTTTTVIPNGAGMVTIGAFTTNDDGTVTSFPAVGIPGVYAVAGDGALDVSSGSYLGAVSASGNVAMFAGGTMAGDAPEFWFMFR